MEERTQRHRGLKNGPLDRNCIGNRPVTIETPKGDSKRCCRVVHGGALNVIDVC